jgi:hypothetical protein
VSIILLPFDQARLCYILHNPAACFTFHRRRPPLLPLLGLLGVGVAQTALSRVRHSLIQELFAHYEAAHDDDLLSLTIDGEWLATRHFDQPSV